MQYDDFDTQIQIDEMIPPQYERRIPQDKPLEDIAMDCAKAIGHDLHEGYIIDGYRMPLSAMQKMREHVAKIILDQLRIDGIA